ncbi:MAG: GIY-YIG nuclease family protein [Acidobacteria bacterium]|nr:GIY-YIG nuclease family protein [Acidobacteriota bacterium]
MKKSNKDLKKDYQQQEIQMGIYQIRNTINGKIYIGSALNLQGIINSNRFQLKMGSHKSKSLQEDWNKLSENAFVFEVLDEIKPKETTNIKEELNEQLNLWLDNLEPYGEKGYNDKIKSREEILKLISNNKVI